MSSTENRKARENLGQVTSTSQGKRLGRLSPRILASYFCTRHAVYLMRESLRLRKVSKWPAARFGSDDHVLAAGPSNPGSSLLILLPQTSQCERGPSRILAGLSGTAYACRSICLRLRAAPGNVPGLLLENEFESQSCSGERPCRKFFQDGNEYFTTLEKAQDRC